MIQLILRFALLVALISGSSGAEPPEHFTLKASARAEIPGPFAVDAKSISKIARLMKERLLDVCPSTLFSYNVEFADESSESSYTTLSLDHILEEENRYPRIIVYLSLIGSGQGECAIQSSVKRLADPRIEVQMWSQTKFHPDSHLFYEVSADNEDWVRHTEFDLSTNLKNFLTTYYLPVSVWHILMALTGGIACCLFWALGGRWRYRRRLQPQKTPGVQVPFGELFTFKSLKSDYVQNLASIAIVSGLGIYFLLPPLISYIFPTGVILLGEEVKRIEQINNLRTAIVSFVGGSVLFPFASKEIMKLFRLKNTRTETDRH